MKVFLILLCVLFPFFYSHAADHIVLYNTGEKDEAAWGTLKKYFDSKGYNVSIYEKASNLEKHLEKVNMMNRTNASLMLALDFRIGEKNDVFVAVTDVKQGSGRIFSRILTIEEIPGQYIELSMEFAKYVASSFGKTVKELPLFPLLGVAMPGIFLRMECTKDKVDEMLNILNDSLQKYFKRSIKNEG